MFKYIKVYSFYSRETKNKMKVSMEFLTKVMNKQKLQEQGSRNHQMSPPRKTLVSLKEEL